MKRHTKISYSLKDVILFFFQFVERIKIGKGKSRTYKHTYRQKLEQNTHTYSLLDISTVEILTDSTIVASIIHNVPSPFSPFILTSILIENFGEFNGNFLFHSIAKKITCTRLTLI